MPETPPYSSQIDSPLGVLNIMGSAQAIEGVGWMTHGTTPTNSATESCPLIDECANQLRAYFDGRLTKFDVPLAPAGTPYQRRVWQGLQDIPYGQTVSYGQLSQALQPPSGPRAVGSAVGRNPIALLLPCHRVIGGRGELTGFAWGLAHKAWLLSHEGSILC
ncbi:MAG: methylated-DNA--[protein]-cysteine S-methyltransferase [Luminiphilus sp.]|nr:methylated-DNA--[protein]-cysteine S-methyltransferase [Luminiphilus sp.]